PHPITTLIPYTTLFRSVRSDDDKKMAGGVPLPLLQDQPVQALLRPERPEGRQRRITLAQRRLARTERFGGGCVAGGDGEDWVLADRKSTRLNSSHSQIS